MNRREFLKTAGMGAAGFVLAGCGLQSRSEAFQEKKMMAMADTGDVMYRTLPHTGVNISTIGIGASNIHESNEDEIHRIFDYAADRGINLVDTVMSDFTAAAYMGKAMQGKRDAFVLQMHIGATYPGNTYVRTRDLTAVKEGFEKQLQTFHTDYTDIGLIHYVDQEGDYDAMLNNGLLAYAQKLKQEGVIRNIGFSSHSVDMSHRFLDTGLMDVFMFSLNPAYDFVSNGGGMTLDESRKKLYERAQQMGVGITVMKAFGGGRLLSEGSSPFGRAMTPVQCIQYCLDRPAVVSVIPGVRNMMDMKTAAMYYSAPAEERSYSDILSSRVKDMDGVCIYCGHCSPCVKAIDIAAVNKFYDLAQAGDNLAKDHYMKLDHHSSDCVQCGQCEPRCPFHVDIRGRMKQTQAYFGV
jgi:predicted aldo/keto reductase-like oxidoreductase